MKLKKNKIEITTKRRLRRTIKNIKEINLKKCRKLNLFFSIYHAGITDYQRKKIITETLTDSQILSFCKILKYFLELSKIRHPYDYDSILGTQEDLESKINKFLEDPFNQELKKNLIGFISASFYFKEFLPLWWEGIASYEKYLISIPTIQLSDY